MDNLEKLKLFADKLLEIKDLGFGVTKMDDNSYLVIIPRSIYDDLIKRKRT